MRRLALLASILLARIAHAEDPRDVFGLGHQAAEPPLDCSDGLAFGCAAATDPLADAVPYAMSTWLPASYLLALPVADARHDAVASYAMGASRDGAGVSFAGANGLENRWTVDGAPTESVRTGAAETSIPLTFLDGILVTAGGFAARDRTSTGGTIDARLRRGTARHELDVRAWAGISGSSPEPPVANNTYQLRKSHVAAGPTASASIVATGPLPHDAWYAAGLAPSVARADFTWRSARLVDHDGDGIPDGLPGLVQTEPIETTQRTRYTYSIPAMARAGFDRGPHHVELTLLGSASRDVFYLDNATLPASGVDRTTFVGDAIGTWRGVWHDTRARVQAAWHRSERRDSASDPAAANEPQLLTAYVPTTLTQDPRLAAACASTEPDFFPCPIPIGWFASGGAGALLDRTADRPSITADLAHQFGPNVLRVGATGEDARLLTTTRFSGGEQIRSLFEGHMSVRQFVEPSQPCPIDDTQPCPTVDSSTLNYRTRYTAAYVEDTWSAAPNIRVDGGLRWELMWVGGVMHFSDELAPRLGITWDPLGGGRSRVWTSMGRSFALIPAGIGATILGTDRTVDNITSPFGLDRSVQTGEPIAVAPGVEPVAQDELTAGAEVALARSVRATVWTQGRWLARGLDTTPEGLDNPGRSGGTPALRQTGLIAAELATAPTARLVLRIGYMYQRTVGSWTGAYNRQEGAVLFAGSDFDISSVNQLGALPTDAGHRVYVEAQRGGQVGPVRLSVATRLTVASGAPRDVYGDSDDGLVYLLPRGSAGRDPMQSQANLRLGARWHDFDITLDLFDVFDRREPSAVDQVYASGAIHPIDGGTQADLVFLKTDLGQAAPRATTYQLPTGFQGPFSAVLGVHRAL